MNETPDRIQELQLELQQNGYHASRRVALAVHQLLLRVAAKEGEEGGSIQGLRLVSPSGGGKTSLTKGLAAILSKRSPKGAVFIRVTLNSDSTWDRLLDDRGPVARDYYLNGEASEQYNGSPEGSFSHDEFVQMGFLNRILYAASHGLFVVAMLDEGDKLRKRGEPHPIEAELLHFLDDGMILGPGKRIKAHLGNIAFFMGMLPSPVLPDLPRRIKTLELQRPTDEQIRQMTVARVPGVDKRLVDLLIEIRTRLLSVGNVLKLLDYDVEPVCFLVPQVIELTAFEVQSSVADGATVEDLIETILTDLCNREIERLLVLTALGTDVQPGRDILRRRLSEIYFP